MAYFLFCLLVSIAGLAFFLSAIFSHSKLGHRTAGWWAGVFLSFILFAASQGSFQSLPEELVRIPSGCSTHTESQIKWDSVYTEATQIKWWVLLVGLVLGFCAFEILDRCEIPEKTQ